MKKGWKKHQHKNIKTGCLNLRQRIVTDSQFILFDETETKNRLKVKNQRLLLRLSAGLIRLLAENLKDLQYAYFFGTLFLYISGMAYSDLLAKNLALFFYLQKKQHYGKKPFIVRPNEERQ